MNNNIIHRSATTLSGVASFLLLTSALNAQTYDLAADWSDTSNPNGPWTYLYDGVPGAGGYRAGDPFNVPPGPPWIWGIPDSPFGWSKSLGSEGPAGGEMVILDLQAGDIYGHASGSSLAFSWTSSSSGPAHVSGETWMLRNIGRQNSWTITLNGNPLGSGVLNDADPYDRTNPNEFSFDVNLNVGDVLQFAVDGGDYLGVNFTVNVVADADGDGVADALDGCPNSELAGTVVIGGCDTAVPNTLLPGGCTIADKIAQCATGAKNHGAFVSCVAHLTNTLKKEGLITNTQKSAIQSCAAQASIP